MRMPGQERRASRERSRDRDASPAQTMPQEWGGRTLRTERMIAELNERVIQLSEAVSTLQSHCRNETSRLSAMESAIPERMHKIEERQAAHVELVNQMANYTNVQLDAMNKRVNAIEEMLSHQRPGTPGFGPEPKPAPAEFSIGTPRTDNPFAFGRLPTPATPPRSTTPSVPVNDPWAKYVPQNEHPTPPNNPPGANRFNYKDWSVSDKKVSKALNLFDSNPVHYRNWADRVKDHCKEVNPSYSYIFELIEKEKQPIDMNALQLYTLPNGVVVDMNWVAKHLWSFIGRNVTDTVHGRRLTLTQNQEDNGIELWRALFVENEGGAEQVQLGGMNSLHSFPQCPGVSDLQHWVGQWQITRQRFGNDLPEMHLRQMFLNMLPASVSEKLRERRDLQTLQDYINEVNSDLGRLNDSRLAKVQAQRMKNNLHQGPKNPVHAVMREDEQNEENPSSQTNPHDELSKKLDGLIAALNQKPQGPTRGRRDDKGNGTRSPRSGSPKNRPDSRFKGCLHCGDPDHFRRDCPDFKAILAKNGNKLPAGYKGKYERWKESQKKKETVAAIHEASDDEFPETYELWAMPALDHCRPTKSLPMPKKSQTSTSNGFDALRDDSDDESEVLEALKQLTPKIQVGPKVPQKRKKTQNQPLSRAHVAHIARQVKNGKISLPEIDVQHNSEYEAIWALVDSGAGRSCAKKDKHFAKLKIKNTPSKVKMSTANGHELHSRGTFKLNAFTAEGNAIQPNFEDADVDMPILAVTDISQNGVDGTETRFRTHGGEIIDLTTQNKSAFIRRRGVYFIKMFYKPDQCPDDCHCDSGSSGFTRPGTP